MDGIGSLFESFVEALKPSLEPIIVSYPPTQGLGYENLEAIAEAALPSGEPFVLVGESFSGPIAISIASRQPPGLVALILVCTFSRSPLPVPRSLTGPFSWFPVGAVPFSLATRFAFGNFWSPALGAQLQAAASRVASKAWRARIRSLLEVDVSHLASRIQVPVLYLRATRDRLVSKAALQALSCQLPSLKTEEVEGPHFLLQAKPKECAASVRAFASLASFAL